MDHDFDLTEVILSLGTKMVFEESPFNESSSTTCLFIVPRLHLFDGTSTDILIQMEAIRARGFKAFLFCRSSEISGLTGLISQLQAEELVKLQTTTVICHFCGFDRNLFRFATRCKGLFILRYQNVTPPIWFWRYSLRTFLHAMLGRFQVLVFLMFGLADVLMPASHFSRDELLKFVPKFLIPKVKIVPVLGSYVPTRSPRSYDKFKEPGVNIEAIFVGRVVPSKGLIHLVGLLREWKATYQKTLNASLTITVAGKISPEFQRYHRYLLRTASNFDVQKNLVFVKEPSAQELSDLYSKSDVFIFPSEHEGFGVPIIEAQCIGLPIIALDRGATSETMGDGGILVERTVQADVGLANGLSRLIVDSNLATELSNRSLKNLDRFESTKVLEEFTEYIRLASIGD